MSRMLKALRQLEAVSAQVPQSSEPVPPEQLPGQPSDQPEKQPSALGHPPQGEGEAAAGEPLAPDAAIHRALERIETAAAAVDAQGETAIGEVPTARPAAQPPDPQAQAYARLADRILSQAPTDHPAVLMFTSPSGGEGKTQTLVRLARALGERTEGDVLLVDGNLRKPDLAGRLGIEASRGLADVLIGMADWKQVVAKTSVPGLELLPGVNLAAPGGWPPRQLNLHPLFEQLRRRYPLILIDAASLAHGEVAPIARHCDGTYLVVRLRHTTRRALAEAAEVIRHSGGRLLGTVIIGG